MLDYTIGFLLGDGYFQVTKKGQKIVRVAKPDLEPIKKIQDEVAEFTGFSYKISQKNKLVKGDYWGLDISSKALWDYVFFNTSGKTDLPSGWIELSQLERADLLKGLIDSDGSVAGPNSQGRFQMSFSNNNVKLVNGVARLCNSLNIACGQVNEFKSVSKGKDYGYSFKVTINLASFISSGHRLICARKQNKIDLYAKNLRD